MSIRVIDYKGVEMTNEEYEYYKEVVDSFSDGTYSGREQFRDVFNVDDDGCITMIKPPLRKQIAWAVLFFLQNLMINQRIRRMEKYIAEFINDRKIND